MPAATNWQRADPLAQLRATERVNYADGRLLDARDFQDEQSFHSGRLARALKYALGMGTLAGLGVSAHAGAPDLELWVAPGLAIDRRGRLIEAPIACAIRLARWYRQQDPALLRAARQAAGKITADVFLRAQVFDRSKTPAFAAGPFDALDAVVPSRKQDGFALDLLLRTEVAPPVPVNNWLKPPADPITKVMGAWLEHAEGEPAPKLPEHLDTQDENDVLLARVTLPLAAGDDPDMRPVLAALTPASVTIDNSIRPVIFLAGKWLGEPLNPAP